MEYSLQIIFTVTCVLCCERFCGVNGGSCWLEIDDKNNANADASTFIATNITRRECCQIEPAGEKYYSDDEPLVEQKMWVWKFVHEHKCSMACQDGCSTFSKRCDETEICRVKRNKMPKCICNPKCSSHHLSRKGNVCGDDGKSYSHHCQLLRQKCRKKISVEVAYLGECKAFSCDGITCAKQGMQCVTDQYNRPKCVSTENNCGKGPDAPVCATDGKTYPSLCHMTHHTIRSGQSVKLSYHGPCSDNPRKSCKEDNLCKLCLDESESNSYVCIKNPEVKCPPTDKSPTVCGEDGVTYKNECTLKTTGYRLNKHIAVAHVGACNATTEEILAAGRYLDNPKGGSAKDIDNGFRITLQNKSKNKRFGRHRVSGRRYL